MSELPFCSLFEHTNEIAVKAALKLLEFVGEPMKRVVFGCSGSESIECAIKIMRSYWDNRGLNKKKKIISFTESYHGTYYGGISAGGLERSCHDNIGPCLPEMQFINGSFQAHMCARCSFDCLNEVEELINREKELIAGIIIEPILASKGGIIPCTGFLRNLVRICKENDILVTMDEVATGFYRTGSDFYFRALEVSPDIVCLSKGINSGYLPLAATVVSERIVLGFTRSGQLLQHGSTQGGNLLACASMIASLEQYNQLSGEFIQKAPLFKSILNDALVGLDAVEYVYCAGFMFGIALVNKANDFDFSDILEIRKRLLYKGVIVYYSEIGLTLMPILTMEIEEWKKAVRVIADELCAWTKSNGAR
jgi:adenosylmethionine-8-amino-7-oxononanoate aminotransferase